MQDGLLAWTGGARFSNGYGDAIGLAAVLVENHSLKPYKRSVLGTYVLMTATLELLSKEQDSLRGATLSDRWKYSPAQNMQKPMCWNHWRKKCWPKILS